MIRAASRSLATNVKVRAVFLLLGIAIAVPIGLVTERLSAATIVISTFSILLGLAKMQQERSAQPTKPKLESSDA